MPPVHTPIYPTTPAVAAKKHHARGTAVAANTAVRKGASGIQQAIDFGATTVLLRALRRSFVEKEQEGILLA